MKAKQWQINNPEKSKKHHKKAHDKFAQKRRQQQNPRFFTCYICGSIHTMSFPIQTLCSEECRLIAKRENVIRFRHAHPERCKIFYKKYRQQNKEIIKQRRQEHARAHPEIIKRRREKHKKKTDILLRKIKSILVHVYGGCCQRCGYSKCLSALDFHHSNKSQKSYLVSKLIATIAGRTTYIQNMTWDILLSECDKCELICANCHREEHSPYYSHSHLSSDHVIKSFMSIA